MSDDFEEQYIVEVTEPCAEGSGVSIDDFHAYMPSHSYIFTPCREIWAAASVNARLAANASAQCEWSAQAQQGQARHYAGNHLARSEPGG